MKLLVKYQYKDSYFALPPEKQASISMASLAYIDKYSKAGKLTNGYFLGNMKGGVSIWDVASAEEAALYALEFPLFPFIDNEIEPLIELEVGMKVKKELMKAAQKPGSK